MWLNYTTKKCCQQSFLLISKIPSARVKKEREKLAFHFGKLAIYAEKNRKNH
jgi:hypothetical protein